MKKLTAAKRKQKHTHYLAPALGDWLRAYCHENGIAQSRLISLLLEKFRQEASA